MNSGYISSILHKLLAYYLMFIHYRITKWGTCTLECQETQWSTFSFAKIKIACAVPQMNSCLFVLVYR